jgi:membrane protease YdiL (CAAX protease family)
VTSLLLILLEDNKLISGKFKEFLFRGGLMPAFGLDWRSALATGANFGILHLSGGHKNSYAIWLVPFHVFF